MRVLGPSEHNTTLLRQVWTLCHVRVGLQQSQEGEEVPEAAPPNRTFVWGTSVDIDDVSNRIQRFMRNFREGVEVEGKYMQLLEEVRVTHHESEPSVRDPKLPHACLGGLTALQSRTHGQLFTSVYCHCAIAPLRHCAMHSHLYREDARWHSASLLESDVKRCCHPAGDGA